MPEKVISHNGPCSASHEFVEIAEEWNFTHSTSTPHFPQSNGLAEKSVQTVKSLFSKAKTDHKDTYLSLLEHRNTPLEEGLSPSQLLMSRRLRSVLPSTHTQLLSQTVHISKFRQTLIQNPEKQKCVFDKGVQSLKPLAVGKTVRIKYNEGLWKPAVVSDKHGIRSFTVETQAVGHIVESAGSYLRREKKMIQTSIMTPISLTI